MKIYKIILTGLCLGSLTSTSMASTAVSIAAAGGGGASVLDLPECTLTKEQKKKIKSITGYTFKNDGFLASSLKHSSLGNGHFELLEALGDKMIGAIVALKIPAETMGTAAAFHGAFVAKTINVYFAGRYRDLGLDKFFTFNPGADLSTIHANALEALVGAIALDSNSKKPWKIVQALTPIVEKLVWNPILVKKVPVKKVPVKKVPVAKPAVAAATMGAARAKSTKVPAILTITGADGMTTVYKQKARGQTFEEARINVLLGSWKPLGFSSDIKKGKKKITAFEEECRIKGYTMTLS